MFGNCFFSFIFCFQKQFSIFETQTLVLQPKYEQKTKIILKTQFVKKTKNMQNVVFTLVSNF